MPTFKIFSPNLNSRLEKHTRRRFLKYCMLAGIACTGILGGIKFLQLQQDLSHIRTFPDPALRVIAAPIIRIDEPIVSLCKAMADTLHSQALLGFFKASMPRGLAATQMGIPKRVIVCGLRGRVEVMINPEITHSSGAFQSLEECLSLPDQEPMTVTRSAEITIHYYRADKSEQEITVTDSYAALLEHEIDHLNGVLYTDRA